MSSFRGFSRSDFDAFAPHRTGKSTSTFNKDRKAVHQKLILLKEDVDPLLERKGIELQGSVSDYWINSYRREVKCLWLRYPAPKEKRYEVPHLELTVWHDEIFVGLVIPQKGHEYQENLLEHIKVEGPLFLERISHLPGRKGIFRIWGSKKFFEGEPKSISATRLADFTQSTLPGVNWIVLGYYFDRNDSRVRSQRLAGLAADIFSNLYWLYEITQKKAPARTEHPGPEPEDRSPLRPFEKKRISDSKTILAYEVPIVDREKSLKAHKHILNLLAETLKIQGYQCYETRNADLIYQSNRGVSYLFEVKSCNARNAGKQIRMGISQLYEYRYFQLNPTTRLFLVTQVRPPELLREYLENDRDIGVIWLDKGSFHTTAKTKTQLYPLRLN